MVKKKNRRIGKKKRLVKRNRLLISPDGGQTVYEQLTNGQRGKLISKTLLADDVDQAQMEEEMTGVRAIQLRRKYPALEKAWQKYVTVWHLVSENE